MEPQLTGLIVWPDDVHYDAARKEWNTLFNKFPLVIVFAQDTEDVVNAVRWARYWNIPIRTRSGRHSYEGLSAVDGGIVIDVSQMKQVNVDGRHGVATVQTGTKNIDLYHILGAKGLVVPAGVCPTTGIAGVTLGGGHSMLTRPWGLTLDHLLELEMVDANGCVLQASANRHADLFWAYRGSGGGNFGICTSFCFRARRIDTVGFAEISWNMTDLETVLRTWQSYTFPGADERLTPTLFITSGLKSVQSNFAGDQSPDSFPVVMQGVFLGPATELCHLLQPLLRTGSPRKITIEELPWLEVVDRLSATQPTTPSPFKSTDCFIYDQLPETAINTIRRFIDDPPTSSVTVLFHGLGGAVARVPSHATAYFHRQAWSKIAIWSTWDTPDGAPPGIRWEEEFRKAILPYTWGVYVNSPNLAIKNWPMAYYGDNFEQLTRVKAKYDPENVFHFPQSIPPV
ncbi:FAD-binding oxidoreductase [Sporomusa sp. KB1]|jgi:FAD/FMN-containing dehydrogenase|uniref:FAD-binding oxidoreductase n=1 Tax=Sporomusa sp. KB1 TaxID=943346 RepID=UPI001C956A29|nr:FAD-binding oxidoreductase [Sporomusa sp. KB1]